MHFPYRDGALLLEQNDGRVASLLIFNDITSKKPEIAEMLHPFFASAIIDSAPSASATSQIKTITTPASQAEWSR